MGIHCADIENLVQTYLDDELSPHDCHELEEHVSECATCRERVAVEAQFGRALRKQLAAPPAPDLLRRRIVGALDSEDRRVATEQRRAWILPGAATVAAAAALVVFAIGGPQQRADDSFAEEAVIQHMRRPPVEVSGDGVSPWIKEHFMSTVSLPRFAERGVELRGARLGHLRGRDAARLFYEVQAGTSRHEVQVHIFDASNLDLRSRARQVIGGRELWFEDAMGYSVVTYRSPEGLGYVFTSDMRPSQLVDLVVSSDLLLQIDERLRSGR